MPTKALIFDFDGLILDTESAHYRAWTEAYAAYGLDLPLEKWAQCIGTDWNAFNPYGDLEARAGDAFDRAGFKARKDERAAELISRLQVRPGILELLDAARERGYRLGVASSSDRSWVEGHLARLSLRGAFEAVKTADDVLRVKPDPELYLTCLSALGAGREGSLVLEDSPNGIKAAKAAGLYTVAYPNSVTERLDLSQADRRVDYPGPDLLDLLV